MKNSLFFHKIVNNTIVCKTAVLGTKKSTINGVTVYDREQGNVSYGLLCLLDESGNSLDPSALGLKKNQELKGFQLSSNPVLDQETDEPTGMFWVESTQ